jgi:hypothetical protein
MITLLAPTKLIPKHPAKKIKEIREKQREREERERERVHKTCVRVMWVRACEQLHGSVVLCTPHPLPTCPGADQVHMPRLLRFGIVENVNFSLPLFGVGRAVEHEVVILLLKVEKSPGCG